jgi:histidine kinase/DNA gyrase B/HSP90-like ATPase
VVRAISWPLSDWTASPRPAATVGGPRPRGTPGGTGLGLALVRSIARGHRGEVRVRSALRAGSRFELMLPAMTAAGEGPAGVPAPAQAGEPLGDRRLW